MGMSDTATRTKLYVHREADGYIVYVSSLPPDPSEMDEGDTVAEFDAWVPDEPENPLSKPQ